MRACGACSVGGMNWMKVSLPHEYIIALNNIYSSTAFSPNADLVQAFIGV
jgi:hypothetical protein